MPSVNMDTLPDSSAAITAVQNRIRAKIEMLQSEKYAVKSDFLEDIPTEFFSQNRPSEEDLLGQLYVQDFGSKPTVKLPSIPRDVHFRLAPPPDDRVPGKKNKPHLLVSSIPIYQVYGKKEFVINGVENVRIQFPISEPFTTFMTPRYCPLKGITKGRR